MLKDVLRTILERYSTFPNPREIDFTVRFGDVVSDQQAVADWLGTVGWAFHRDEVRELMDHQPWDQWQKGRLQMEAVTKYFDLF